MNKIEGKNKGTKGSKRPGFRIAEIGVLLFLATLAILYDRFARQITIPELVILTIAVIILWLLAAFSAAWFYSRPRDMLNDLRGAIDLYGEKGDRLQFELKTILGGALEKQPYVDDEMLSIIESNASNIWVISTDLRNDVNPGKIREAVEANLKSGKQYTYFVPSQTNPNFPDAVLHEKAFKKWDVYLAHRDQVRFIHLPDDTLFLFREVIIYNPLTDPNNKDDSTTPKGFTYFETATDTPDKLMKIPNSYLQFLKGQLNRYSEGTGLDSDIERLIPELRNRLATADLGYLASLFGQRRIEDRQAFKQFLDTVRERDSDAATILEKVLGRYLE
jgi:hypothetical protein